MSESKVDKIQDGLSVYYEFRYNEITKQIEFRYKKTEIETDFKILTHHEINNIIIKLRKDGIYFKKGTLFTVLYSDYVDGFNPLIDYFESLPPWDESTDYIQELAQTVKTNDDDMFELVLAKWLVSMVKSIYIENYTNTIYLIFSEGSDPEKNIWIKKLIPDELKDYFYVGSINPSNMNDRALFTRNILIQITGIVNLSSRIFEKIKAFVSETRKERASKEHSESSKTASCISSIPWKGQIRNDLDSNKRVFLFDIESVNFEHNISIESVFAQAVYLFKEGYSPEFNLSELSELSTANDSFDNLSIEYLIDKYLTPSKKDVSNAKMDKVTDIMNLLYEMEGYPRKATESDSIRAGKILTQKEFPSYVAHGGIKKYYYKLKQL